MGRPPLPIGTWGDVRVTKEDAVWRASARYRGKDGITRTYSRRRRGKQAAKDALLEHFADMKTADRNADLVPESRTTLLLTYWLDTWEASKPHPPATVRTYRRAVEIAKKHVGGILIRECTTQRLEAAVNTVRSSNGIETGRQVRGVLMQTFATALRLGVVDANPALGISTRKGETKGVRVLTPDEVRRLRTAAREWQDTETTGARPWVKDLCDALDVMLGTGVRIGELLALRWEDVDLTTVPATITVSGTVTRSLDGKMIRQEAPKSEASRRVLYLPKFVTRVLRDRERVDVRVFPSSLGLWRDPSGWRKNFRDVRKLASIDDVTPHTIRATVATAVYSQDGLDGAGMQLGHADVGVTSKHYVERISAGPVEVVAILDGLIGTVL